MDRARSTLEVWSYARVRQAGSGAFRCKLSLVVHTCRSLDPSCQTYRASFVSINESHFEALAVIRGILLNVRNYQRRAKVESYPARSFTCCRPSSIAFYSLEQRWSVPTALKLKNVIKGLKMISPPSTEGTRETVRIRSHG